jgi:hypothetical protein
VAIATGTLISLAPQELVDCVTNPDHCGGSGGCGGATQELGYAYAMLNGMGAEADYPYKGSDGTCQMGQGGHVQLKAGIKGYVKLPENNNTALLTVCLWGVARHASLEMVARHIRHLDGGMRAVHHQYPSVVSPPYNALR